MKTWLGSLVLLICIIFFVTNLPSAESQINEVTVVLFEVHFNTQFNEGQTVHLKGQVIYRTPDDASGLPNSYYRIINQDTGKIINEGRTDQDGIFIFNWSAVNFGKKETNLIAIYPGTNFYNYAKSNILELEVFSTRPPPKPTYHNTFLSLQVTDGSSTGYVQVFPKLTYGSGITLGTPDISIYVGGIKKTQVSSNQWSSNIFVGDGTHTIRAGFSAHEDSKDSSVTYRASTSNTETFSVGSSPIISPPTPPPPPPLPPPPPDYSAIYAVIGVIVVAVVGVGIALSKRKKVAPVITAPPAKAQVIRSKDDTQFWVCPRCEGDIQLISGKQYCRSCNVYL